MERVNARELVAKFPTLFGEDLIGISIGPGWLRLVEASLHHLSYLPDVRAAQIKEKFGGLRIYLHTDATVDTHQVAAQAEGYVRLAGREAWRTCERCGAIDPAAGARNEVVNRWMQTLCQACKAKKEAE